MIFQPHPRSRRSAGVSLLELLIVLAIIAVLMALTLVAVQHSRTAARRRICQTNLQQISLALRTFVELKHRFPDPAPKGSAGGWSIELLPFLEETNLHDRLMANPSLSPGRGSPLLGQRPAVFSCPSGYEDDSEVEGIPAAQYTFVPPVNRARLGRTFHCQVGDLPTDSRLPWAVGPEVASLDNSANGPHSGEFNVEYIRGD